MPLKTSLPPICFSKKYVANIYFSFLSSYIFHSPTMKAQRRLNCVIFRKFVHQKVQFATITFINYYKQCLCLNHQNQRLSHHFVFILKISYIFLPFLPMLVLMLKGKQTLRVERYSKRIMISMYILEILTVFDVWKAMIV
mgnify:CR=1 FL=1